MQKCDNTKNTKTRQSCICRVILNFECEKANIRHIECERTTHLRVVFSPFFCRFFSNFLHLISENAKTRRHVFRAVFFLHCCILRQKCENTTRRKSATIEFKALHMMCLKLYLANIQTDKQEVYKMCRINTHLNAN